MTRLWAGGEPLNTWGGEETPKGFDWRGTSHRIQELCNRWQVHTRWWDTEGTIWRQYLKVATDTGLLCRIYRDLLTGRWVMARLYD
jgi:hypothetical protein